MRKCEKVAELIVSMGKNAYEPIDHFGKLTDECDYLAWTQTLIRCDDMSLKTADSHSSHFLYQILPCTWMVQECHSTVLSQNQVFIPLFNSFKF